MKFKCEICWRMEEENKLWEVGRFYNLCSKACHDKAWGIVQREDEREYDEYSDQCHSGMSDKDFR